MSGDVSLRPIAEALRGVAVSSRLPGRTPTQVIRRGALHCPAGESGCELVFQSVSEVTTVDAQ
jgi:hypothetical protein